MTAIAQKGNTFVDGTYETETDANGNLRHLHYLSGGDGLFAIYETDQDGKATMNYIHKDYQGSFETITDNKGTVVERLSFDPWGRRRNATDWTFNNIPETYTFDRGYTGHEHLEVFGLINMNGRMYDPMLGRFLSPDNYVQAPDYTQNFNRYSYVMNNPLKYTDPSGESFMSGNLGMYGALAIFIIGSISDHLLNPGDYNDKNVGAAIEAGYKQGLHAFNEINSVGRINLYQDEHWNVSISPSSSSLGINTNVSYTNGDFTIGGGVGANSVNNPATNTASIEPSAGGGITYYDRANGQYFSYYATRFGGQYKQTVGGLGYSKGDFSVRFDNDFFANSGDKYRTNALEFGYGDFVLGTNLWTNDPGSEVDPNGTNLRGKTNKHGNGAWKNGQVLSAPLYLGYKLGSTITRVGFSHRLVQDRTQNFIHKNFHPGYTHFFNRYDSFQGGAWSYYGYYNPYTLY